MQVVIIGAGLAGLTCGRELLRRGVDVILLEASDGVGGRVRSDHADGYLFDRGFQVVFDSYPAIQRQIGLAALDLRCFDPGAIICYGGKRAILTDPLRDLDRTAGLQAALTPVIGPLDKVRTLQLALELRGQKVDQVIAGEDEDSLAFLRRRGFSTAAINRFFRPFYGGIFLDRSLETSAKCLRFDFKMLSDGSACLPAKGMGRIAELLAEPLIKQGCIRLGVEVTRLLTEGERVVGVQLADGSEIRADVVVVATSAPEAARLSGLPMPEGVLSTVTLYFAGQRPVYRGRKLALNAEPDAFVNNAQMLTNVAPEYAPSGQHLLSATVLGMPDLNDSDLFRRALHDLHRMFAGDRFAQAALAQYQPVRLYRIPYAQFRQTPGIHPHLPDNRSGRAGLYFAGEFTEASSLNAAMISGEKCAALI